MTTPHRTVNLHITQDDYDAIGHNIGDCHKLHAALGYFTFWGNGGTYPTVDIFPSDKTDIVAVYKKEDGTRGYTIAAVWNKDTERYGFHS